MTLVIVMVSQLVFADVIYFNNGSKLTCEIIEILQERVNIQTGKSDIKSIPVNEIARIEYKDGSAITFGSKNIRNNSGIKNNDTLSIKSKRPFKSDQPDEFRFFSTAPLKRKSKKRSLIWMPLLSFFLPGFDQYLEGQIAYGFFYTGVAILGISMIPDDVDVSKIQPDDKDLNNKERKAMYGAQLYQTAGCLSAYHSFRTAVHTHKANGEFTFLSEDETPFDIMMAPFKLTFLGNWTTLVPLGLLGGLTALAYKDIKLGSLDRSDYLFATGISYNAGTGEEALFRGWMMPLLMHYTGSGFWSNTITAGLFAAAHISGDLKYPAAQFLLGWYFGWLTQKRHWTIEESVFIHTWWDIIVFTATLAFDDDNSKDVKIQIPVFFLRF
jgi:membrane protease YdiL (CAAX protease family)